jgi:hypothetical protein
VFSVAAEDDEEYGFCGLEGVSAPTAPLFRSVEHLSGDVVPQTMPAVLRALDLLRRDRDKLIEQVQGIAAERDNFAYQNAVLGEACAVVTLESKHAIAARDDAEAQCAALDEELQAARCRIEELET